MSNKTEGDVRQGVDLTSGVSLTFGIFGKPWVDLMATNQ